MKILNALLKCYIISFYEYIVWKLHRSCTTNIVVIDITITITIDNYKDISGYCGGDDDGGVDTVGGGSDNVVVVAELVVITNGGNVGGSGDDNVVVTVT